MKTSSDTSRDRTSDLPICNTAPYPLCYRGHLQGKAPKEIHAILTETLACFLPGRDKNLSAPL